MTARMYAPTCCPRTGGRPSGTCRCRRPRGTQPSPAPARCERAAACVAGRDAMIDRCGGPREDGDGRRQGAGRQAGGRRRTSSSSSPSASISASTPCIAAWPQSVPVSTVSQPLARARRAGNAERIVWPRRPGSGYGTGAAAGCCVYRSFPHRPRCAPAGWRLRRHRDLPGSLLSVRRIFTASLGAGRVSRQRTIKNSSFPDGHWRRAGTGDRAAGDAARQQSLPDRFVDGSSWRSSRGSGQPAGLAWPLSGKVSAGRGHGSARRCRPAGGLPSLVIGTVPGATRKVVCDGGLSIAVDTEADDGEHSPAGAA